MYFFFYIFDGWSIVKLTGTICSFFHSFFNIFDGWSIVKLTGLCGWSYVALGASVCSPGPLWAYVGGLGAVLGTMLEILGLYRRSWAALGASVGGLGCSWAALGAYVGNLGPTLGLRWRS